MRSADVQQRSTDVRLRLNPHRPEGRKFVQLLGFRAPLGDVGVPASVDFEQGGACLAPRFLRPTPVFW